MSKIKLFFKWAFVFTILGAWSILIIGSSISGSVIKDSGNEFYIQTQELESQSVNLDTSLARRNYIPFYIPTNVGIEKASSSEIIEFLFYHNFSIQKETQEVPEEKCSLRAKEGYLEIDGLRIDNRNRLSFKISLKNDHVGSGSLTVGKGDERFSLKFEISEIIKTDADSLSFRAEGDGKLGKRRLNSNEIVLNFDKINNKINISGVGDEDFQVMNMTPNFVRGCGMEEKTFYLISDEGERDERRSIEDVRSLLDDYPELISMNSKLRRLYKDYWWALLPGGMVSG
jgi:hypothetical protein